MRSRRRGRLGGGALIAGLALLTAACGQSAPEPSPTPTPSDPSATAPAPSPSASPSPTPEPALAWGPTVAEWDQALADAAELTDAEAAAVVVVPGFVGTSPDDLRDLMEKGYGGVLLQGESLRNEETVTALAGAAHEASTRDWGTIVSVDQEGGKVDGLGSVLPSLPSFMAAGATHDPAEVSRSFGAMGLRMVDLGFTMDFAPVADATIGPQDPIIGSRSASDDPARVTTAVIAASEGLVSAGIVPVVKHFPGHGSVTTDSHLALPVQDATVAALEERDLIPFAAAVEAGVPVVMTGHIVVPEWSEEPATLAPEAYAYLREELGFEGLVVTDALNMAAVADGRSSAEVAVAALSAGADVLLLPASPGAAVDGVVAAVGDGDVPRERLTEAAARVILLGRWQQRLAAEPTALPDPDSYGFRLASAGITLAQRDCSAPAVTDAAYVTGGFAWERERLQDDLASRGIDIGSAGTQVHLSRGFSGASSADVVVAVDAPWWLESVTADAYVGLYGRSAGAYSALADVLVGLAQPRGTWPVDLDLPYEACTPSG